MRKYFPFLDWLTQYDYSNIRGDLIAGTSVAVMLIPQSMAIALLAGLPPIIGLYASVVPVFIYALFASSRHLAVGPVALVSLLVASGIGDLAQQGSQAYIVLATLLAGLVGLIQFAMGIGRFGFLVNFLSHPVISGFTSAAALIIAFSQLRHFLGIEIPQTHYIHQIFIWVFRNSGQVNLSTLAIGVTSIATLVLCDRWKHTFPLTLTVVAASALAVWGFDLHKEGVAIIGELPRGLRAPSIPDFNLKTLAALFPIALAISLVAFMESIAIAKAMAERFAYEVDANQELIGLGLANIAASFFGGYPVTGGFSRSAINAQAGARTALASIITAGSIALTLLFLTDFLFYMPTASLAAIVIVAVISLIDTKIVPYLYRVKRTDLISLAVTFVATLSLGIEKGILLSVGVSLVLIIKRTTRPHYAILGRLPGTKVYRNVERYPEAITLQGLIVLRIDASLYFANAGFLKELMKDLVARYQYRLSAVILDLSSVNDVDSSANEALQEIAARFKQGGIKLYITNVKGPVRDMFMRSGFLQTLGEDHFFLRNHDAVKLFLGERLNDLYEIPPGNLQGSENRQMSLSTQLMNPTLQTKSGLEEK